MFLEATTLATVTRLLEVSLREHYGVDPAPIYAKAGIPLGAAAPAEARYPLTKIKKAWELARAATGDEAIGLTTGRFAKATQFHAFGYSWLASSTLLEGLQRLTRYITLVSTASVKLTLIEGADSYALEAAFPDPSRAPPREGIDCGMTALLALCDSVAEKEIRPLKVELSCPTPKDPKAYREALRSAVQFDADVGAMYFRKEDLRAALPGGTPAVARATDRVIEQYIETLDPSKVATKVRQLLVELLPSGQIDQDAVCSRLNRSRSSLLRQLQQEGLSYRDVLDGTRQSLAEDYLKRKQHSHAEIAFMLGFSDQSNFARAFKRWTSLSPGQFQETMS
jgi:AraC-like DNA-binding protein